MCAELDQQQPWAKWAQASRETLVNIHAHDNEPLETDAQRSAYYRYFMANVAAGTAGDLALPPPKDRLNKDGYEDFCRACQQMHAPRTS